jgi:hypothetical protein
VNGRLQPSLDAMGELVRAQTGGFEPRRGKAAT